MKIPMMKMLALLLLLSFKVTWAQTQTDYTIWSKIITNNQQGYEKLPSIILISQYKNTDPHDFALVEEFSKERNEISDYGMNYLALYSDSIFQKRIREDQEVKTLISGFTGHFEDHPEIDVKRLNVGNVRISAIASRKFHAFFKDSNSTRKGWERFQTKYQSSFVMECSRIEYHQKLACLYYAVHCGALCGAGVFVILEQIDGEWKVLQEFELWVS